MKIATLSLLLLVMISFLLNGCVAIPPLINVQHRDMSSETSRKLDDIDKRLQRLEEKLEKSEKR